MLLISRSKDLWKILMFSIFFDLQLPPLAPNIFSRFSNHQGALFFFFFLLLSLPSAVLQWHHVRGNFYQSNWVLYVGCYLEVINIKFLPVSLEAKVFNLVSCVKIYILLYNISLDIVLSFWGFLITTLICCLGEVILHSQFYSFLWCTRFSDVENIFMTPVGNIK